MTTTAERLRVERNSGSGYQAADWLGADVTVRWPLAALPTATLGVTLAQGWAVQAGAELLPLEQAAQDDVLYRVLTDTGNPAADQLLFEGRVQSVGYHLDGGARRAVLRLAHVGDELRCPVAAAVRGQLMLTTAAEEGLSAVPPTLTPQTAVPRVVTALDCVFNPRGVANCASRGGYWYLTPDDTVQGGTGVLPLFMHARTNQAVPWTWARVLLYLLALPRMQIVANELVERLTLDRLTEFDFREAPAADGLTLTERLTQSAWHTLEPGEDELPDDPWAQILLRRPNGHSIEGLSWLAAWEHTLARCGLVYTWEPIRVNGAWRWGLRVETCDSGAPRYVRLPTPEWTSGDKPWAETQAQANVSSLDLEADFGEMINSVGPAGAVNRREVTIELVPGWPANADWDVDPNNPSAVQAAIDKLGSAEWRAKYVEGGTQRTAATLAVGRLWGVNTHGAWSAYHRDAGPWAAPPDPNPEGRPDPYRLFDLADVRLGPRNPEWDPGDPEAAPEFLRGHSAVRARRFGNCLTGLAPNAPRPPLVEISFDAGAHWRLTTCEACVSTWDLRVWLRAADLLTETQTVADWPDPGRSLPEAYIRGQLRLRITATIDTDDCCELTALRLDGHTLSARTRHLVLQRRDDWALARRDDYWPPGSAPPELPIPMGNSLFNRVLYPSAPEWPSHLRDDDDACYRDVVALLRGTDRRRWRGAVEVPWLQLCDVAALRDAWEHDEAAPPAAGYRPGDLLVGLETQEFGSGEPPPGWQNYELLMLAAARGAGLVGALIVEVEWLCMADPPAVRTRLAIEDRGRVLALGGRR